MYLTYIYLTKIYILHHGRNATNFSFFVAPFHSLIQEVVNWDLSQQPTSQGLAAHLGTPGKWKGNRTKKQQDIPVKVDFHRLSKRTENMLTKFNLVITLEFICEFSL